MRTLRPVPQVVSPTFRVPYFRKPIARLLWESFSLKSANRSTANRHGTRKIPERGSFTALFCRRVSRCAQICAEPCQVFATGTASNDMAAATADTRASRWWKCDHISLIKNTENRDPSGPGFNRNHEVSHLGWDGGRLDTLGQVPA